jgi:hypothetical protein
LARNENIPAFYLKGKIEFSDIQNSKLMPLLTLYASLLRVWSQGTPSSYKGPPGGGTVPVEKPPVQSVLL